MFKKNNRYVTRGVNDDIKVYVIDSGEEYSTMLLPSEY